jgi:hypothetical protein
MTNAEAKLPSFRTQCKRHNRMPAVMVSCALWVAGVIMGLLLHGDMFRCCMEKKLTNSDPFMESTDNHSIFTH